MNEKTYSVSDQDLIAWAYLITEFKADPEGIPGPLFAAGMHFAYKDCAKAILKLIETNKKA